MNYTGGTPDLRRLVRDTMVSHLGHDFGIGISSNSHYAFFSTIKELNVNPLVKQFLSYIQKYLNNKLDVFDLAGSISIILEEYQVKYREKNILQHIYKSFDNVDNFYQLSSVNLRSIGDDDLILSKIDSPRLGGRVLKYSIFLVIIIFVFSLPGTSALDTPFPKKVAPLPIVTGGSTPWWSKLEAENVFTSDGYPDTNTELFFEKYTKTIRRQHEMRTKQFHLSDNMVIRVNYQSKIVRLQPQIHKDVVKWSEYMVHIIDPAYLWSSDDKLVLNLSPKIEKGFENSGGYFNPNSGDIWIRDDSETLDPLLIIQSVIHEISHKVHLDQLDIAVQCRDKPSALCKHRTTIHQSSDITSDHIASKYEEAQRVLYLGMPSENMTADEAKLYIKLHLDTRIRHAYEAAVKKRIYHGLRQYDYAMTEYKEYWAEASTSFIVGNYSRFPDRDWIKQNDRVLYDILEEVYSGFTLAL